MRGCKLKLTQSVVPHLRVRRSYLNRIVCLQACVNVRTRQGTRARHATAGEGDSHGNAVLQQLLATCCPYTARFTKHCSILQPQRRQQCPPPTRRANRALRQEGSPTSALGAVFHVLPWNVVVLLFCFPAAATSPPHAIIVLEKPPNFARISTIANCNPP